MDVAPYYLFQKHTAFVPLKVLYPECFSLIDPYQAVIPLQCFRTDCPANKACAEVIAKRIKYLHGRMPSSVSQIICYYKYRDRPNSIRGVVFDPTFSQDPKLMVMNPFAFTRKFQKESSVEVIHLSSEYWNIIKDGIIPVEALLR